MFNSKNIRFKLLTLVVAILIPLTALVIYNTAKSYEERIGSQLSTFENLSNAISTAFNNYMEEIWVIQDIIGTYVLEHPGLTDEAINQYFKSIIHKQAGLASIVWLNHEGQVVYTTDERLMGLSFSDRSYFQEILNGKRRTISNLIKSKVEPYQSIIVSAYGIYRNQQLAGVVTALIELDTLQEKLPDFHTGLKNSYMLVDRQGNMVYSSDLKRIPEETVSYRENDSIVKALQGDVVSSIRERSPDNSVVMSASYPIPEIGWVCRISTPYHEAMFPHVRKLMINVTILIISFLISLFMAMVVGNVLLRPVTSLRSAARRIMNGDYSARTNIKGNDEIGLAAEAFDKMAESIEQWYHTKSQFYANLSHELKTPLGVIFSSVQLIDNYKSILEAEQYRIKVPKQMKIIRQNCYRIMRLINNFIDISKHDSGFLKIKPVRFDIVKLVKEITLSVTRYAEVKGILLVFESDLESKIMPCDPDMMERIMLNLISNAIKFTDRDGKIIVRLEDAQDELMISVSDSGVGIPQDKLNLIFERFKQADNSLMRNREGSGIGLSLVKAFVEAHGGTITAKSELNKGTTFTIRLPAGSNADSTMPEDAAEDAPACHSAASVISRINIEFSDIYSFLDEEIS